MLNRRPTMFVRTLSVIAALAVLISPLGAWAATPGSRLWTEKTATYASWSSVVVSPDGSTVFVTGWMGAGYRTEAHDSATGDVVWSKEFAGGNADGGGTLVVSPDGTKIFVAGLSTGAATDWDFGTIAYDASDGAKLWFKRYDGAGGPDSPSAAAISPDGSTVVVAGSVATGPDPDHSDYYTDYGTVAYDAATGSKLWARIYNPVGDISGRASDVVITADGKAIVTGTTARSTTSGANLDAVTIAYDLATGRRVWLTGHGGSEIDVAYALALSPNDKSAYVAGYRFSIDTNSDFATWGLRTATGTRRWLSIKDGPASGYDDARSVVVAPNGTVFVTGNSSGGATNDFLTIAYEPTAGVRLWSRRYNGPANGVDNPFAITLSADGSAVYVTGSSRDTTGFDDWATISYDAASGVDRWTKRFSGSANVYDRPSSIAASPDGAAIFVAGNMNIPDAGRGLTIAYAA